MVFDDAPDVLESRRLPRGGGALRGRAGHASTTPSTPSGCRASSAGPAGRSGCRQGRADAAIARFAADYTAYFEAHNREGATLQDAYPRVVVVGGLGMFTTGKDRRIRRDRQRHLSPHDLGCWAPLRPLQIVRLALGERRLRRRVLAAGALQAPPRPRRRRSCPGASRSSPARRRHRARGGAASRPPRARTWWRPISTRRGPARWRRRSSRPRAERAGGWGSRPSESVACERGPRRRTLPTAGRHRGLQRRHRALGAGGPDGSGGAPLRGELHRALPRRPRVHAGA